MKFGDLLTVAPANFVTCLASYVKAKLQKEGIFFPHPFICQRHFINEKVGNRRN